MLPIDDLGKRGEEIAKGYLETKGYQILERNWRTEHREIDIIAREKDEIVIVEVKSRMESYLEAPWEAVTSAKIRNLVEAANVYLIQEEIDLETRFDVISIGFKRNGSFNLEHFEHAFIPLL